MRFQRIGRVTITTAPLQLCANGLTPTPMHGSQDFGPAWTCCRQKKGSPRASGYRRPRSSSDASRTSAPIATCARRVRSITLHVPWVISASRCNASRLSRLPKRIAPASLRYTRCRSANKHYQHLRTVAASTVNVTATRGLCQTIVSLVIKAVAHFVSFTRDGPTGSAQAPLSDRSICLRRPLQGLFLNQVGVSPNLPVPQC